MHKFITST